MPCPAPPSGQATCPGRLSLSLVLLRAAGGLALGALPKVEDKSTSDHTHVGHCGNTGDEARSGILARPPERCGPSALKAVGKVSSYLPDEVRSDAMQRSPEITMLPDDGPVHNGECFNGVKDGAGRVEECPQVEPLPLGSCALTDEAEELHGSFAELVEECLSSTSSSES